MNHYYTNDENLKSERKIITSSIMGKEYKFYTDNGVFSKKNIDYGTKVLLENISIEKENAIICDLGCGYGVVSVYLASNLKNAKFTMIDVNKRALELSKENLILNNIVNEVELFENNALDDFEKKFDFIITNPPIRAGKKVVNKIITQSYNSLNSYGELWVVIQKKQGMESLKKLMKELFNNVEIISRNKGYYVLKSKK